MAEKKKRSMEGHFPSVFQSARVLLHCHAKSSDIRTKQVSRRCTENQAEFEHVHHKKTKFDHLCTNPKTARIISYTIMKRSSQSKTPNRHIRGKKKKKKKATQPASALLFTAGPFPTFYNTHTPFTHLSAEGGYRRSIQLALKLHRCPNR